MENEKVVEEFLKIYEAGKSGKALFACQGQGMDGFSQLAEYNHLVEKIINERKKKEG